jgi:hypothetical protein
MSETTLPTLTVAAARGWPGTCIKTNFKNNVPSIEASTVLIDEGVHQPTIPGRQGPAARIASTLGRRHRGSLAAGRGTAMAGHHGGGMPIPRNVRAVTARGRGPDSAELSEVDARRRGRYSRIPPNRPGGVSNGGSARFDRTPQGGRETERPGAAPTDSGEQAGTGGERALRRCAHRFRGTARRRAAPCTRQHPGDRAARRFRGTARRVEDGAQCGRLASNTSPAGGEPRSRGIPEFTTVDGVKDGGAPSCDSTESTRGARQMRKRKVSSHSDTKIQESWPVTNTRSLV